MAHKTLTLAETNRLKNQSFSTETPGTLLKDFQVMLEFIANGLDISARAHLLPNKALPLLNEKLSHPIAVKLTRPIQKSYPNINGLYLLLRASGLTQVVFTQKGPRLVIDPTVLACWNTLNPTEQYFSLLEAWLYRGNPEIIGERSCQWDFGYLLLKSLDFFHNTLKEGLEVKAITDRYSSLKYHPGLHNLALMELFGWITIQLDSSLTENWPISTIVPTDWGRSILKYYYNVIVKPIDDELDTQAYVAWDSDLTSIFPALQNGLIQSVDEAMLDTAVVFKVVLQKAWRLIQVSGSTLFDELAASILDAFGFSNDHLYEFSFKNRYGFSEHVVHPEIETDDPITSEWLVGSTPLYPGMVILFTFDFGDNWEFVLTVDSIVDKPTHSKPKVIEKRGTPPKQYHYDW